MYLDTSDRGNNWHRPLLYILKHRKPVPCDDIVKWQRWFARASLKRSPKRHVRRTFIGSTMISTVFLGVDHSFNDTPMLFETMVLDTEWHEPIRSVTWRQALKQHWDSVGKANDRLQRT